MTEEEYLLGDDSGAMLLELWPLDPLETSPLFRRKRRLLACALDNRNGDADLPINCCPHILAGSNVTWSLNMTGYPKTDSWPVVDAWFVTRAEEDVAALIREIYGNPFSDASIDMVSNWFSVTSIAQEIYDTHSFDRMPILADALEEGGCRDKAVLEHLRPVTNPKKFMAHDRHGKLRLFLPCKHVRGCWVLDSILGLQPNFRQLRMAQ